MFSFALSFLAVEPGYYEDGSFGIRIENIVLVVPAKPKVGSVTSPSSSPSRYFGCTLLMLLFAVGDACCLCVAERSESFCVRIVFLSAVQLQKQRKPDVRPHDSGPYPGQADGHGAADSERGRKCPVCRGRRNTRGSFCFHGQKKCIYFSESRLNKIRSTISATGASCQRIDSQFSGITLCYNTSSFKMV